jgi:hypothetical protein
VITALAESTLLLASVALNCTVFNPTSVQVKLVMSKLNAGVPQMSVVPLSTSVVAMLAAPAASK